MFAQYFMAASHASATEFEDPIIALKQCKG